MFKQITVIISVIYFIQENSALPCGCGGLSPIFEYLPAPPCYSAPISPPCYSAPISPPCFPAPSCPPPSPCLPAPLPAPPCFPPVQYPKLGLPKPVVAYLPAVVPPCIDKTSMLKRIGCGCL